MIRIGKNEDSSLKVAVGEDATMWPVPPHIAKGKTNAQIAAYYEESRGARCEVLDNFNFTATIMPSYWEAHRESGIVVFRDRSDPFIYKMTQRNLLELLRAIIDGRVEVVNGGLYGLFTFGIHGNRKRLTLNVVEVE